MRSSVLSVAILILIVGTPLADAQPQMQVQQTAQAPSDCGCKELRNVKNRLCQVRLAQREYDRIATKFLADEAAKGEPILLDGKIKDGIKDCVQEALNTGADAGAQNASSETDANCAIEDVTFSDSELDASRCIGMSVYRHEQFHQARCREREQGKWQRIWAEGAPVKTLVDTKFAMSAVDYMAEEAAAYSLEEAELTRTMQRLLSTCYSDDKVVTVEGDDWVPGKTKGDEYQLDLSLEDCPTRPRVTKKCKY
jgi:hypothetical protein